MLFFYTLSSSIPLLGALVSYSGEVSRGCLTLFRLHGSQAGSARVAICLMIAFLVKLPMYLLHSWLPKAHVEAPVSGSIVLARVLLKLGGYGIYLTSSLVQTSPISGILLSLRMVGGVILGCLCCRTIDFKVIIAYSSVVHMVLVLCCLVNMETAGLPGLWWGILAHGLVSPGLFVVAYSMYCVTHSRRLMLNSGGLRINPRLSVAVFTLILINFRGPFTLNLFREVVIITSCLSTVPFQAVPVFLMVFLSAAYGLILYARTQHGSPSNMVQCLDGPKAREILVV